MKRTSGLIVAAFGILLLGRVLPARVLQTSGFTPQHAAHSKTTVVPAEDSGDDGDDSGSDDAD